MSDYYDRRGGVNSDGTPLFCVDKDKANERTVVAELEKKWACEIREYGPLAPIDYYALKDGRIVGVIEIKSRTHEAGK